MAAIVWGQDNSLQLLESSERFQEEDYQHHRDHTKPFSKIFGGELDEPVQPVEIRYLRESASYEDCH